MLTKPYQRKNGNQHSRNTPMMMPKVRAALCSARHPLAGRTEPPEWKRMKEGVVALSESLWWFLFGLEFKVDRHNSSAIKETQLSKQITGI